MIQSSNSITEWLNIRVETQLVRRNLFKYRLNSTRTSLDQMRPEKRWAGYNELRRRQRETGVNEQPTGYGKSGQSSWQQETGFGPTYRSGLGSFRTSPLVRC